MQETQRPLLTKLCDECQEREDFAWKVAILANQLMYEDPNFPANYREGTTEEYYVKARRILQGEEQKQV